MPDGDDDHFNARVAITSHRPMMIDRIPSCSSSSSQQSDSGKDPRKIARKYQLELCKTAMEENIIVYLGTGCGMTHIAVLLIYEMRHLIKKPQKKICVFLAPTNELVEQQARVIEDSIDFKVGVFCGSSKQLKTHYDWYKVIEEYEILVMTPQILLRSLYHCFITMERITLLIFDECHHAQVQSNHPYAEIMKVFYTGMTVKPPRVFGMTASPVVGKGASCPGDLPKIINSLEDLLDAKVYSVEDTEELEKFVASTVVRVYHYSATTNGISSPYLSYENKLEKLKQQGILMLGQTKGDHESIQSTKRLLARVHDNMIFCLENLGLYGALHASRILLIGNLSERTALVEAEENFTYDLLCDRYLTQVAEIFASECIKDGPEADSPCIEVLTQPILSSKLLCLIGILSTIGSQPDMKCIILVNRIVTARSLSFILQNLKCLTSWRCHFLVGVHASLKSMTRKAMNDVLEKFRSGELNLLVATKVGEEGLDIQTCCLVIRFDLPETASSFIQSRGRARMPQSEYAFLVDSGNQKELDLINSFKNDESRMNFEISYRSSYETFTGSEEKIYKVDSSGASINSGVSLLHQYCSKLPHDEFYDPKPKFYYFDDQEGTFCNIVLPSNAAFREVFSTPCSSMEAAKKDACLKAVEKLHKVGALTDYLLPQLGDADGEESDEMEMLSEDTGRREELHGMLVPAALKEPWINMGDSIHLNSYFIKLLAVPEDRIYRKFGLFVKAPLPQEAERMEVDLHLSHGRYVTSKLMPAGVKIFDKDEMLLAQHFQEMSLKIILDREELIPDYVPLGKDDSDISCSSTFYLLLPVVSNEYLNIMNVDWKFVRRCLSSPIFRTPAMAPKDRIVLPSAGHLQLGNGRWSINDVENSLVYCPQKKAFLFVTNVVQGANAYSLYKDSGTISHADYHYQKFKRLKHPEQPLLRTKQLFHLQNLLRNLRGEDAESHKLDEHFVDLPPELLELKIIGFSKDIGSSLSLLPSFMHHLQGLLVAIELKQKLCAAFPGAAEVTAHRVLEALTTDKCQERFSLERLEILGDSFLKYVVGRHLFLLHGSLDEGQLTDRRSDAVNNSNLTKLAIKNNLQEYIRDQSFDPYQFFAFGRPCPIICNEETEECLHSRGDINDHSNANEIACSKGHRWLQRKTIADVVEALIGAFLVDGGFRAATGFLRWIGISVDFEASKVTSVCVESKSYMPLVEQMDVTSLENLLGYQFLHKGLLLQAFFHPSYVKHGGSYQRLEFLGDAVLDYLITSYIFSVYPELKPGDLTDLRSVFVNNKAFASVAVDRSFHKYLICESDDLADAINIYVDFVQTSTSQSALSAGPKCPKALGDVVDACMGAILLDTGFNLDRVWETMLSFLDPSKAFSSLQLNPVRDLHDLCQSHNLELEFSASEVGKVFLVEVIVHRKNFCTATSASNPNKKDATRTAAHQMYVKLKVQDFAPNCKSLEETLKSSHKEEAILIGYNETPIDVPIPEVTKMHESNHKTDPINNVADSCSATIVAASKHLDPINDVADSCSPTIVAVSKNFYPINNVAKSCSPNVVAVSKHLEAPGIKRELPSQTVQATNNRTDSHTIGVLNPKSAKQRLYEVCAANCWKRPEFEIFKEEGPSHLKSFTCKVILEIEETPERLFECIGASHRKKKAAEESVAEGMLWQLDILGYLPKCTPKI